jgi:hypothetical protein
MLASGAQQICFQLEIGPETLGNASIYNLILAILFRMNILEEEI